MLQIILTTIYEVHFNHPFPLYPDLISKNILEFKGEFVNLNQHEE